MRTVRDIMEPTVISVATDMPRKRAAEVLSEKLVGAPVCEPGGSVVGMVSKTDLIEHFGRAHEARIVRDVMMPEIFSLSPNDARRIRSSSARTPPARASTACRT